MRETGETKRQSERQRKRYRQADRRIKGERERARKRDRGRQTDRKIEFVSERERDPCVCFIVPKNEVKLYAGG